jgi:predicted RNA-binding Zn-ribbon protein involved in translation (DUF1610 family)
MQNEMNRMAQPKKRGRPPKNQPLQEFPAEEVPVDPSPLILKCPLCGAARLGQWETMRGRDNGRQMRCKACGSQFTRLHSGRLRQVR